MAYNGSGTFSRLYNWVTDRDASVPITASRMDAEMDGMATGLSTAITKDGQTTTTASIPFAVGATFGALITVTSSSASALTVGPNGATNPTLKVDASTASAETGLSLKSAAAGAGFAVAVISSGTNENLTVDAKGSGTITLGGTSTGAIILTRATTLSAALTYGGVTLSNAVTGTGNMVLSTSPSLTTPLLGTPTSGVLTNCTGLPIAGTTGYGTGVATALAVNVGSAGAFVTFNGALGSPSSAGTIPAFTLAGTIAGGGNQINNVIIGTSTPLAGSFTAIVGTSCVISLAALTAVSNGAATLAVYSATDTQLRLQGGTTTQAYDIGRSSSTGILNFYGNQTGFAGYIFGGVDGARLTIGTGATAAATTTFHGTLDASAIGTASVVLSGGLSVAKNIYVGGQADGTINIASTSGSSWLVAARGLILHVPNNFTAQITTNGTNRFNIATSGEITVSSSTTASSTSAAALVVTGGVGIGDNLRVANAIYPGAGIAFPATQASSADANTLDDYEEGSWVPTYGGFSAAPSGGIFNYIKVGKMVTVWGSGSSAGTSNATTKTITLPFAALRGDDPVGMGLAFDNGAFKTNPCRIDLSASSATATVYLDLAGTGWTASGGCTFYFSFTYEATA